MERQKKASREKDGQDDDYLTKVQIIRKLGQGAYSSAYLLDNGDVLRVAFIPKEEEILVKQAARADTINYLLTKGKHMFGPSTLELKKSQFKVLKMPENLNLPEIDANAQSCWMQVTEYLRIDPISMIVRDKEEWKFIAFSLIWFFYAAQAEIGLLHQDVKIRNMGFRRLEKPKTFQFKLGYDKKVFIFRNITRVPVVFDFDFSASVGITKLQNMGSYGTQTWWAPECLRKNHPINWGFDFYAVGNILLYYGCDYLAQGLDYSSPYAEEVMRSFPHLVEYEYALEALVMAGTLNYIFHEIPIPKKEWDLFSENEYEAFFGEKIKPIYLKEVEALRSKIRVEKLSDEQTRLIKTLIHWNPKVRTYDYAPYRLLDENFEKEDMTEEADETFSYARKKVKGQMREVLRKYGSFSSLKCSVCSDLACPTCGGCSERAYCGEACANFDWYFRDHHKNC